MEDDDRPTDADGQPFVEEVELHDDHHIALGTNIAGYVIDGELGRGGMGVVYAATHPVIGKRAAIKILKPSLSRNPATVERFIQEARSVNQIGHPNIVDIFDFDRLRDGRYFLIMDLLEGESLRKRVKGGPLHVREAAAVIDEIASALVAAHDKGFIHRDLKPDNVFLVAHPGRFDVRLLDFGLAKLMPSAAMASDRTFRTATGAQLGTPDYMSPEQLRGDPDIDARTDIYALGVMAFEIITGTRPRRFGDGTFELRGTPAEVLAAVPFVPAELAQLVETMLANEPEQRPSLVAIRAVIKRVRPSLPSMSVVGLERPVRAGERAEHVAHAVEGRRAAGPADAAARCADRRRGPPRSAAGRIEPVVAPGAVSHRATVVEGRSRHAGVSQDPARRAAPAPRSTAPIVQAAEAIGSQAPVVARRRRGPRHRGRHRDGNRARFLTRDTIAAWTTVASGTTPISGPGPRSAATSSMACSASAAWVSSMRPHTR